MDVQFIGSPLRYKLRYKKYTVSAWLIGSMLMVSGLLSGFGAGLAHSALTRPVMPPGRIVQQQAPRPMTPMKQPTSTPTVVNILAQDSFQRPAQHHWGQASDGDIWDADANRASVFSVVSTTGRIAGDDGAFQAVLGPATTNAEVLVSGSVSRFDGTANLGALLRWHNRANWYKVFIDGGSLTLIKDVDGQTSQLARVPFVAQGQTSYTIRFRAVGTHLFASVWPTGTPEPANWLIVFSDPDFSSGRGGVRVVLDDDTVVTITSFLETSISSGQ
jgi:hypothetical protein